MEPNKETQEPGITFADYLNDMLVEEKVAQTILSKDETKKCTYEKGYTSQTLFGCKTCGAEGGMCLACYLNCHLDHDTFEIGMKRNFRCDCGTAKFNNHPCIMLEEGQEKTEENDKNVYDHNFKARFCVCNNEYDQDLFMIRCLHCLDYFHIYHLGLSEEIQSVVEGHEDFTQMICKDCTDKHYKFLKCYQNLPIYYTEEELKKLLKDEPEPEETKEEATIKRTSTGESATLGKRTRSLEETCDHSEKAKEFEAEEWQQSIFLKENWNHNLCFCEDCQKMYKEKGVYDVLAEDEVNAEGWEQAPEPNNVQEMMTGEDTLYKKGMEELGKLDFFTQSKIAGLYRDFHDDFMEYFNKMEAGTLITQNHVQEFFQYLQNKKKVVDGDGLTIM